MKEESTLSGLLFVDKPAGLTSRDVVNRVSKILGTKKVGHTGTLDPLATGLLILTIGKCTKLSEFLTFKYKEYEATFTLGYETDTLDCTGSKTKESNKNVTKQEIIDCIMSFKGSYSQEVPAYSAVKIDGKKLYAYAREGKQITLPKRKVEISAIEIISIEENAIRICTTVSKGTYIRSLIRDIGQKLGTYATMDTLRRTKQGDLTLANAKTLEQIESGNFEIVSPLEVLKDVPSVELDDESYKKVFNGCKMSINSKSEYIKFLYKNELVALYKKGDNSYEMYVKF